MPNRKNGRSRRQYSDELKAEAVEMLLDGHSAQSVASRLGLSGTNVLYRWKANLLSASGPAATALEARVQELERELRRVEQERDILKKALAIFSQKTLGHFQPENVEQVYAVIGDLQEDGFATATLCEVLEVHRSRYYAWRRGNRSHRAKEDEDLKPLIREIFWEHKRRYGARRIAQELPSRRKRCGVGRVGRLLREMGLKAIQPKSYRPRTTDSRHRLGYSPNLVLESSPPGGINQVWVGDISYVPLRGGDFLYLAVLMDLYSRRIVGWELRGHMKESLVLAALCGAIAVRRPGVDQIHHSDRGGQYAGNEYRRVLGRAGMRQSMSRAGSCYDNAFMESCFGTIKTELEMECCENERVARTEIGGYIRYYNTRRRHSALDYRTPEEFEAAGGRCRPKRPNVKKS